MHRVRVWSAETPTFRADHNRTYPVNGNLSSAIDNLIFSPSTQVVDTTDNGFVPRVPSVIISGVTTPVRFKAVIVSGALPSGTLLYYRKNNGTPLGLGINNYTSVTFTNGDRLTLGAFMISAGQTGTCSFVLVNSQDNTQCSNILSITTRTAGSSGSA